MPRIAGAVLAAGSGTRMGRPKGDLVLGGERLVDRAVEALRRGGCEPVIAVVRPGLVVSGAQPVLNPDPDRGQRSSLRLAVDAAGAADALLVTLVDTPGIGAAAVRAVLEAWRPGRIGVAGYGDRWGHPIVMPPVLWHAALDLAGPDEGARALLSARPDLVDTIDAPGDPTDIDTPDDLARWSTTARRTPQP